MLQGVIHYLHASIVPKDEIPTSINPRKPTVVSVLESERKKEKKRKEGFFAVYPPP